MEHKPAIGVYKFASCDGCQLAFLNAGPDLIRLAELVDIVHFAEAGIVNPDAVVDIAFIEGSITTNTDLERIKNIRAQSKFIITLGACATAGGLQALRNIKQSKDWMSAIYTNPEYIDSLETSTPIKEHVEIDLELWGCPVNSSQVFTAVRSLLFGVLPVQEQDSLCLQCKREQNVCVMVSQGVPCMGPVTLTGCGAICPRVGRDCYACYGPAATANTNALGLRFEGLGLLPETIARRFHFINNYSPPFYKAGKDWGDKHE